MQDGSLISDFGMKQVYTKSKRPPAAEDCDEDVFSTYVIHLSEQRKYLFALVDES